MPSTARSRRWNDKGRRDQISHDIRMRFQAETEGKAKYEEGQIYAYPVGMPLHPFDREKTKREPYFTQGGMVVFQQQMLVFFQTQFMKSGADPRNAWKLAHGLKVDLPESVMHGARARLGMMFVGDTVRYFAILDNESYAADHAINQALAELSMAIRPMILHHDPADYEDAYRRFSL